MGDRREAMEASRSEVPEAGKGRYLYAFDFDHTILDANSDTAVVDLLTSPLPREIKKFYDGSNWTAYMDKVLHYMASQGITPIQIFTRIQNLEFLAGMDTLLQRIYAARQENNGSRLLIISDANDFFIEASLQGLQPPVQPDSVITNPCQAPTDDSLPAENYLQVKPYEQQRSCPICPINLCKGAALLKYIADEGPFESVFYFGDGGNDLCPAMKLTQKDSVFVRKGYSLDNLIKAGYSQANKAAIDIRAKIHYFENGTNLENYLKF